VSEQPAAGSAVALVTGATDGVGRGVAERLAGLGMEVHVHGRDAAKLAATAAQITASTGNERIVTHRADFASLAAVRALADEVLAATDTLHLLVNNAGIGSGKPASVERAESEDGYELRLAVNYLAPFALTLRLLPLLRGSAPARIVNVASLGQAPIDFDDPMLERSYDGSRAYAQSKLAQISFTIELEGRLGLDAGVTVNALHPNTRMPTKIVIEQHGQTVDSLEDGVENVVRLAVAPELENVSGRFFDRAEEAVAADQAYDAEARARLWSLSEELTGESLA
jgi:NAD(P)-dependent dehydrogenase (short-subunit alcohol dehydrogenase family)